MNACLRPNLVKVKPLDNQDIIMSQTMLSSCSTSIRLILKTLVLDQ